MSNYKIISCANSDFIYTSNDTSNNFTSGTGSNNWSSGGSFTNTWTAVCSSSDGTKLYACDGTTGDIYRTSNSGLSWTQIIISGTQNFRCIACSNDGSTIVAGSSNANGGDGYLHISSDSGSTWYPQTFYFFPVSWNSVSISGNGMKILATFESSPIVYGELNSGNWSWQFRGGYFTKNWTGITISNDGKVGYACETDSNGTTGNIWTNSTEIYDWSTWTKLVNSPDEIWSHITTTIDGVKMSATVNSGSLYVSTDSGTTITAKMSGSYSWKGVCYSSDGNILLACVDNSYIYVSKNDGTTFTSQKQSTLSSAGISAWTGVAISGPISGVCFRENTLVSMADGTLKEIKDIQRGEYIITDKDTNETKAVARVIRFLSSGEATLIREGLIGNTREIICTKNHPIWVRKNVRLFAGTIPGVEKIEICECLYTIQFEDEGTYYVEGVKVDAVSPDHRKHKLPKELYFDNTKYDETRIMEGEDDPRRNKPKMISSYHTNML